MQEQYWDTQSIISCSRILVVSCYTR